MKILAIDSSGLVASAAIATKEAVLAEYTTNFKKTHSETLLPMIDEVVKMTETNLSELSAIAVTAGPGSFTGLRIGCATAKGLGQALHLPIVSVPTTLALSNNFAGSASLICPLMDARRAQVYTGLFSWNSEKAAMETVLPQCAVPIEEILQKVNEIGRPAVFLGDGLSVFTDKIKEIVMVPYFLAPPHLSAQKAASVAACAFSYLAGGVDLTKPVSKQDGIGEDDNVVLVSAADFTPIYLRKSQAEREREEGILAKGSQV